MVIRIYTRGKMMKHYDQELKDRVIQEVTESGNMTAVARKHGLPSNTVHGWITKDKNKGKLTKDKELKRIRSELEDARLENAILKELLKKTNQIWLKD